MVKGDKPSGYFVTYDIKGRKVEGELRQCAHCQFTWESIPGSGRRRGFCVRCTGLLCGRTACMQFDCVREGAPFFEGNFHQGYTMAPGGLMVKAQDLEKQARHFPLVLEDRPFDKDLK